MRPAVLHENNGLDEVAAKWRRMMRQCLRLVMESGEVRVALHTGDRGDDRSDKDGDTRVEGDVNGDGQADLAILLTGSVTLGAADFVL